MANPPGVVVISSVGVVGSFDWDRPALQTKERVHRDLWDMGIVTGTSRNFEKCSHYWSRKVTLAKGRRGAETIWLDRRRQLARCTDIVS